MNPSKVHLWFLSWGIAVALLWCSCQTPAPTQRQNKRGTQQSGQQGQGAKSCANPFNAEQRTYCDSIQPNSEEGGETTDDAMEKAGKFDSESICTSSLLASDYLNHTMSCQSLSQSYPGTPVAIGAGKNREPSEHGDLNIFLRGFACNGGSQNNFSQVPEGKNIAPSLTTIAWDEKAPRLQTILGRNKTLAFGNSYSVFNWDWNQNAGDGARSGLSGKTDLIGVRVKKGDKVFVPSSGYDIGGGFEVVVLYATPSTITMAYIRNNHIAQGYAIHVTGICVDPILVKQYQALKNTTQRPGLAPRQAFATAVGNEIQYAIRDTGSFMGPTSGHDWFQEDKYD